MNSWNHLKAINIISFIAAIGGIFTIVLPVFITDDYQDGFPLWRRISLAAFQTVYLNYFTTDFFHLMIRTGQYSISVNLADLCFFLLFLAGAITFAVSGFKNVRIIGFCFAVVFFVQCTELIVGTISVIRRYDMLKEQNQLWWTALYYVSNFTWLWLSHYVLKTIRRHRSLSTEKYDADGVQQVFFNTATRAQRFVHSLVDRIMILLLCSTWIWVFASAEDMYINRRENSEIFIVIYLAAIIVYYLFFESILGITPAKFLTATRVADEFGEKPSFGKVVIRTLSRFVPFDALSFFGSRGWHDSWSNTYVLNETIAEEQNRFSFEETMREAKPVTGS